MVEFQRGRHRLGTGPLQWCLGAFIALVTLKFLVLLAEFDWNLARPPWGLLIVVVVPALALIYLIPRYPRAGAAVSAALLVLFIVFVVSALARDGLARQSWADYPLAYGGLLLAAVALYLAVRMLREPQGGTVGEGSTRQVSS
jgi:hypothetical protein